MSTYDLTTIKLPNNDVCNLKDNAKLPLAGGTLTGRVITSKTLNQIITGEGTAAQDKGSSASPRYFPAKWTFDTGLTATDGDILTIKIPVAGHDYGVYMSIDNGTNYAPVVTNGTGRVTTHYPVNTYITLVYEASGSAASMYPLNGGNSRVTVSNGVWRIINYYDSGNNVSYQNRLASTCTITGSNKIFPYTFIMQNSDGRWESIVTSASTGTSKARNTHGFRLGHVLLMYANVTYNENEVVSGYGYIYSSYTNTLDHRYSFNTANNSTSGTTANKPIYLVGSIGNDGLFYLDTTWWTQTLPSTEDGKLYIYLGNAYDYYRMIFNEANPVYWYKNGAIRQFIQDSATVAGHTVALDVPANAIFTDEKVKQSPVTTSAASQYRLLLSHGANDTEESNVVYKHSKLFYMPSIGCMFLNDYDNSRNSLTQILPNKINIAKAGAVAYLTTDNGGEIKLGDTATPSGADDSHKYALMDKESLSFINNYTTTLGSQRSQTMTVTPYDITVSGDSEISGSWIGGQTSLRGALSWVSNNAVAKAGDTMTGNLTVNGGNIIIEKSTSSLNINGGVIRLNPVNSTSDDSGDLVWYYGNGQEKCRLFTNDLPTVAKDAGIRFRAYAKDGSDLITTTTLLTRRDIQTISNTVRWKSTTTTFSQVSGLSFSVPAYSVAIVTAQQMWSNAIPRAIGIGTSTGNGLVALNTNTSDDSNFGGCHISTTGTIINSGSTAVTYNIYCTAKTVNTTGNDVKIKGIIIPFGA